MDKFLRWLKAYLRTCSSFVSFLRMSFYFLNKLKENQTTVCTYYIKSVIWQYMPYIWPTYNTYLIFSQTIKFQEQCYSLFKLTFLNQFFFSLKNLYPCIELKSQTKSSCTMTWKSLCHLRPLGFMPRNDQVFNLQ